MSAQQFFYKIDMDKNKIKKSRKKLSLYKQELTALTPKQFQIAIGVLLGDANIQTQNKGKTYRLRFEQSDKHKEYIFHLFEIFNEWVLSEPKQILRKNNNNRNVKTWRFQTISHKAFNILAQKFLDNNKKSLEINFLTKNLTPLSLAYWFMDDGGLLDYTLNKGKGIVFNTHSFSSSEVENLKIILIKKFQLKCWVKLNKKKPILVVSGTSYEKIKLLIKPFIISYMLYKFPSDRKN